MEYLTRKTYEDKCDETDCFVEIKGILMRNFSPEKSVITDNSTGELLFIFERGNIEYMQGEFAKRFFKWAME